MNGGLSAAPNRHVVVSVLGVTQIFAWGSSYYLPAVLARPIAADTGWSLAWVVGGLSFGLLVAGTLSPLVGRQIQRHGGRTILAASSALLASGLALQALAHTLPVFLFAWLIIGAGMGAGLYDAAFATLGRLYGPNARSAITNLTLFGGFASTICWPLTGVLAEHCGWRETCAIYAGFQLLVALPLHLLVLPASDDAPAIHLPDVPRTASTATRILDRTQRRAFLLLAIILAIAALMASILSVHLLTILQARGLTFAAAVALGALVGPSQVGARVVEMAFGRHYHPIWTLLASVLLTAGGVGLLFASVPFTAGTLALYGAGIGIGSIAKGTLPLAVFGSVHYATLMGWLALPSLLAQALGPSLGAVLLEAGGPRLVLAVLNAAGLLNVGLAVCLGGMILKRTRP